MWRSSYADLQPQSTFQVFSTYVEVILFAAEFGTVCAGILHVCGGHPSRSFLTSIRIRYSPRMWRSSCHRIKAFRFYSVFSTYVEVIPLPTWLGFAWVSILHVCGGHPVLAFLSHEFTRYSPRMWRSSQFRYHFLTIKIVFSTSVEVILTAESGMHCGASILHVCGGDPLRDWLKNWILHTCGG